MKNTTLLKVLSATAIFSAVAAIEAYDQDNFAFAAEETPIVANNSTTSDTKPTTTKPAATPAANSATASSTAPATTAPKAEEPATVAQDVKALKDGEYKITAEALKFYEEGQPSMAAAGLDNEKTKLIVKNGQYSVSVTFKPIKKDSFTGYLGDLKYYDGDKTHNNRYEIKDTKEDSEFKETNIVENYTEKETDEYIKIYKENFPNRTVYPKTFTYNVDKNKIDVNNKLETFTQVFVPVMENIFAGSGTQRMILKYDLSSLTTKTITIPKVDTEKLAKEKAEKERIKREKLAKEKAEKERIERERLTKEKAEKERIEREKLAKEKAEKERIEKERLAKEKAEKERIERERLAKEKAEKERIEKERLAKEKAEKERLEREKAPVTAKGEPAIAEKPEFALEGYLKNHQGPITAKGEAAILDKPEFDLDGYIREQNGFVGEATPASDKKPLINDIFGQSKVKDTFAATPVGTKKSNATTANVKKSLANTGISTASTVFLGLTSLLAAFVIRRKFNK